MKAWWALQACFSVKVVKFILKNNHLKFLEIILREYNKKKAIQEKTLFIQKHLLKLSKEIKNTEY